MDFEKESQDLLCDLEEFMNESEKQEVGFNIEDENFAISTDDQANYCIRQITQMQTEIKRISDLAKNEIEKQTARINRWQEKNTAPLIERVDYLKETLKPYIASLIANSKKKSIKFPAGTAGFSSQQDKYEYDEVKILEILNSNEHLKQYIKLTPSVKKAELKSNGQVVDNKLVVGNIPIEGVVVTPQEDKFTIK